MFKTAKLFAARLSEVEKIHIRGAHSQDHLDGIFFNFHAHEFDLSVSKALEVFKEVRNILCAEFAEASKSNEFGLTWKF
jgi:hypothetical protein